eukprot:2242181-Pyramimonas_sp.AAC.1
MSLMGPNQRAELLVCRRILRLTSKRDRLHQHHDASASPYSRGFDTDMRLLPKNGGELNSSVASSRNKGLTYLGTHLIEEHFQVLVGRVRNVFDAVKVIVQCKRLDVVLYPLDSHHARGLRSILYISQPITAPNSEVPRSRADLVRAAEATLFVCVGCASDRNRTP